MNARIVTGVFALAFMLVGTAKSEVLPDGSYSFSNKDKSGTAVLNVQLKKVRTKGANGIYEVTTSDGKYLYAASSSDGAQVEHGPKATFWELHKNSNGWNFLHADDGANAVSHKGSGSLHLRRNNAGGRGNADQLWQMKRN